MIIHTQRAYILISTLILIFSSSLIVLAAAGDTLLVRQIQRHLFSQHLCFLAAEAGLVQAEKTLTQRSIACLYSKPLQVDLSSQNLDWWQKQCSFNFNQSRVYYVVETLAYQPCLLKKNVLRSYSLYRISSYASSSDSISLLQSTYALPSKAACYHPTQLRQSTGRLSWRQLD